jgi:hypothetical protein
MADAQRLITLFGRKLFINCSWPRVFVAGLTRQME